MWCKNFTVVVFLFCSAFWAQAQNPEIGVKEIIGYDSVLQNLGPAINTRFTEVRPVISPDGKTLYFARQFFPKNKGGQQDEQDIWYATRTNTKEQKWSEARSLGSPVNTADPNGVCAVTPDGNSLLLINTYNPDGSMNMEGASITTRTKKGWTLPAKVNILNYYNNNTENVDYFLSTSGKILLMAVERKEGAGELDLYVSFQQKFGTWSKPLNLGQQVNSGKADFAPFLAADEKTLYFASEGHKGYGKSDIFYAKRLDDTWQNWSAPVNLGPNVNSPDSEAYYTVSASGSDAYLVSAKEGTQNSRDIFRIALKEKFKPEAVILVTGKVIDKTTGKPIDAKIVYIDYQTGKEIGTARTSPIDGSYTIVLPKGTKYGYRAEAEGYIAMNEEVDAIDTRAYKEESKDLEMVAKEAGNKLSLNNLVFERGKYDLLESSFPELDLLVQHMNENPTMEIEIQGHTDNQGDAKLNLQLSQNRVNEVRKYLIAKGIDKKRIRAKGYGGSKPIYSNAKEETRKMNRRVDFVILKK
jgi:outer membrane protein OmpA-like peptidoglycan-associated protein